MRRNQQSWIGDKNEVLTGFSWKGGAMRNTTGIIIWSDVFLYENPNGSKIAILLMDTQGLFDYESTPLDNSRIFSLSTLISSVQIFNLFNNIQEDHLEYLQFTTELAKHATKVTASSKTFQDLMFLVRDWGANDDHAYGLEGGKELLNIVLKVSNNQNPLLRNVRENISKSFKKISCFLMPHPGLTVATKKDYDGRWEHIEESFIEHLKDLVKTLLAPENLTTKEINHESVMAGDLFSYIYKYAEIYKSGGLPQVETIYEAQVSNNMLILKARALAAYLEIVNLEQSDVKSENDIKILHEKAKKKGFEMFDEANTMCSVERKAIARAELHQDFDDHYNNWIVSARAHVESYRIQKNAKLMAMMQNCMKFCGCGAFTATSVLLCCICFHM